MATEPRVELISFQRNLLVGQGVKIYEKSPFAGVITTVTIHWPGGCNALVDVAVWHGRTQFCPREGYLALDDATPTYPGGNAVFNEPVKQGEEIWVEMRNGSGFPHVITVTVSVQEK